MQERIVVVETWHYVVVQVPVMVPMMWQPWDHSLYWKEGGAMLCTLVGL